eukprot:snap_masked-scaffold_26-processed-gene-4.110-mRNA-1 protein AED:1.00 eAED:1.00 QI:0/0/0/0/1/1/2/0/80
MESTDIESWNALIPRNFLMKVELSCKMFASNNNVEKVMLQSIQYSGPINLPMIQPASPAMNPSSFLGHRERKTSTNATEK